MPEKIGPVDDAFVVRFGGGLNTRASPADIDDIEAAEGFNFQLDLKSKRLRSRDPFDLVGTAPNDAEIRGGASLLQADGTVTFLIQAGTKVYSWDGLTTFTEIATINGDARLRGHWRSHYWPLDDILLITDLGLVETVKEWDGTTLTSTSFTDQNGSSFSSFYAKYLTVSNERAIFAHTRDAVTNKHMLVGCKRGDYTQITVTDRPSSAMSEEDPFFLLTPDLKAINGQVEAFGIMILSTENGQLFQLSGSSAQDFAFDEFYPGSAAGGEESVSYIGNDVIYGRRGRIESVRDTDRYGDSEADDLTRDIADKVQDYESWQTVYNARLNRVYCFPSGASDLWVFQTAMRDGNVSPWMRWRTRHAMAFQPTFVMSMLDPVDGLEYVFMGDSSGNLYRLEGSGTSGDGGTANIQVEWVTKLYSAVLDAEAFAIEGWIKYEKAEEVTLTVTFEYAGENIFDESLDFSIPDVGGRLYYGSSVYYGGTFYYGSVSGRVSRQPFFAPGQAEDFQVRFQVDGTTQFTLNELGIRLAQASS